MFVHFHLLRNSDFVLNSVTSQFSNSFQRKTTSVLFCRPYDAKNADEAWHIYLPEGEEIEVAVANAPIADWLFIFCRVYTPCS
jgi:hypothetical protein